MSLFDILYILAFSCSTAALLAPVFALLAARYNPKGDFVDRSHIWVNPKTRRKVGDASARQVYEKIHGPRGWEIKTEKEKKVLVFLGLSPSLVIYAAASAALFRSGDFGRDIIPFIIGGVINIVLYIFIVTYDLDDLFKTSMELDYSRPYPHWDPDRLNMSRSEYFLMFLLLFMAVLAVLQQVFFWLKAYRTLSLRLSYGLIFLFFCLGLIALVFRKIKPNEPKRPPKKTEAPLSKADVIPVLIGLLGRQTDLTKKALINKQLTALTGEDFGWDASDWENWWKNING
jgi:hypothetical protein